MMKTILLDKIGSVTLNCRLPREVRVGAEISAVEGSVVAARVLTSKSTYNTLELPSGRFSQVKPGDVIAGALGHRKALFGYSGHVPSEAKVGDKLNLLNLGGVIGVHDGGSPDLGVPFVVELLGQVLHFPFLGERIGVPAHITQGALPIEEQLDVRGIPVVVLLMLIFYVVFASLNISPLLVAVLAFGMNFAAYVSEMFRSGIESIDRGQSEAGIAMGFTRAQTFRFIVLPQMIQRILPVYKGEFISMVKMTSIVGYIAVQDLTKASDIIRSRTFDPFFPLIMVAVLYFVIAWVLLQALEYLERNTDPKYRRRKAVAR